MNRHGMLFTCDLPHEVPVGRFAVRPLKDDVAQYQYRGVVVGSNAPACWRVLERVGTGDGARIVCVEPACRTSGSPISPKSKATDACLVVHCQPEIISQRAIQQLIVDEVRFLREVRYFVATSTHLNAVGRIVDDARRCEAHAIPGSPG